MSKSCFTKNNIPTIDERIHLFSDFRTDPDPKVGSADPDPQTFLDLLNFFRIFLKKKQKSIGSGGYIKVEVHWTGVGVKNRRIYTKKVDLFKVFSFKKIEIYQKAQTKKVFFFGELYSILE